MRCRVLVVLAGVCAVLLAGAPLASAEPDPASPAPAVTAPSGQTLPKGFPDDLKKFFD